MNSSTTYLKGEDLHYINASKLNLQYIEIYYPQVVLLLHHLEDCIYVIPSACKWELLDLIFRIKKTAYTCCHSAHAKSTNNTIIQESDHCNKDPNSEKPYLTLLGMILLLKIKMTSRANTIAQYVKPLAITKTLENISFELRQNNTAKPYIQFMSLR
jgi:hypothetical protein